MTNEDKSRRIAIVTGGNRGLGLETCRQLATGGVRVVLAARRGEDAGAAAAALGVDSLALDVTDGDSIAQAVATVRERYHRVDILVNNAGVAMEGFDAAIARATLAVNTFGPIAVTDAFRPLLSDRAAIVMVSSQMGELACVSPALRARFTAPNLSRDQLTALMEEFVGDVAEQTWEGKGWPNSAYRVSKVGLNAFTRILAREIADTEVCVNAVCPGWVRTDMGGMNATRSVEEGARSIVWAATLPPDGPTGGFFRDGAPMPW